MDKSNSIDTHHIEDRTLRELLCLWQTETDSKRKERLKQTIIGVVEVRERSNFLLRFAIQDFETWNQVLTEDEADSNKAHKDDFYEPHLTAVLQENGGQLDPIKAIQEIVKRVKGELKIADYALTASKRFRYDTTIRFLADSMKKRGILSTEKEYKNKLWKLIEKPKAKDEQQVLSP